MGRGGGQVISLLAFYFNDPSSNPFEACTFFFKYAFEMSDVGRKTITLKLIVKMSFPILKRRLKRLREHPTGSSTCRKALKSSPF